MSRYLGLGDGSDGTIALGSYTQIVASCSGSSGSTSLTATNASFSAGQRVFIHQSRGTGAGSYEDNKILSYTTGTITLVHPLENDYTDSGTSQAQVVVVPQATDVTGSLTVDAWDGDTGGLFVIACTGTFSGTINANNKGFRGGTGANSTAYTGEGDNGASALATDNLKNGNGGGGGIHGVYNANNLEIGGAGGGNGTAGENGAIGAQQQIDSGESVGDETLSTIFLGGGGGGGAGQPNTVANVGGNGGRGGGIIVVYANKIDSSASLTADGEGGKQGSNAGGPTDSVAGGGAGAGGSILIKGKTIDMSGTMTADGGSGHVIGGGDGGDGRIRIESCSITGTTSPTASESEGGHAWCGSLTFIM